MRFGFAAALVMVALTTVPDGAVAQPGGQDCAADPATLPAELAGWSARALVEAASDRPGADAVVLEIGKAADASLKPTADVRYIAPPEKPGGPESHGGLFVFAVDRPGTYRVALGRGAWVDVLKGETPIASVAHGHGPECSGIRKMVDFPLTRGRYILQIAGSGEPSMPLMVARLP